MRLPAASHFYQFQLIAFLGICAINRTRWQFQHGMRGKAHREAPRPQRPNYSTYPVLTIQIDQVERKFHEECVDRFAGNDPEPGALIQLVVFEKTRPSLRTALSGIDGTPDRRASGNVPHLEFHHASSSRSWLINSKLTTGPLGLRGSNGRPLRYRPFRLFAHQDSRKRRQTTSPAIVSRCRAISLTVRRRSSSISNVVRIVSA